MKSKRIPKKNIPASWLWSDKGKPYIGKEDDFQIAFADYIRRAYPNIFFAHIANERDLSRQTFIDKRGRIFTPRGTKLKRMGVQSGMPDMLIFDFMIAIELKVDSNSLSQNQLDVLKKLEKRGWIVYVIWSLDHAMQIVKSFADAGK